MAGKPAARHAVLLVGTSEGSIRIFTLAALTALVVMRSPNIVLFLALAAIAVLTSYVLLLIRSGQVHVILNEADPSAAFAANASEPIRQVSSLRKFGQRFRRLALWKRLFVGGVWVCAFVQPIACYLANVSMTYQTVVGLQVSAVGVAIALTQMIASQ